MVVANQKIADVMLTPMPTCAASDTEWVALLAGILCGLVIYAAMDAAVYAFMLRRKWWRAR